jgi:methylenetetrahydrofolate dehydrogenase (NADP+)/methenyltetrahydrofolate cyclohydrolase
MSAKVIDGKAFAARLRDRIAEYARDFEDKAGRKAGLAVILVGEDPASEVYVRSKARATLEAGMASFEFKLPAETSERELLARVRDLNASPAADGILVQLPLPSHMDERKVIATIDPD